MKNCGACKNTIPNDAVFCGFCGFRVAPIPPEDHRRLSQSLAPLAQEEPIQLLTKPKPRAEETQKPQLQIVSESEQAKASSARKQGSPQPLPVPGGNGSSAAAEGNRLAKQGAAAGKKDEIARCAARFPLKVEVSYNSEHNFYTGFLENISSGGLFVATHQPVVIGDRIELTFTVPGLERTCTAACAVRWLREYNPLAPDTIPGMGLQFQNLDTEVRAAIELFIKHREPIFFDDE